MSLNIKNERAHRLAAELARLTGESLTRAVTLSLEERLARIKRGRRQRATKAQLLAIGRRCAAGMKGPPVDHGDLLYDERGLPK